MDRSILVLTALKQEARAIERALGLSGRVARVVVIGIRGRYLAEVAHPAAGCVVVMAGIGGALKEGLAVGDCVVDEPEGRVRAVGCLRGMIHTAEAIVGQPEEKRALHEATGAMVVDMEQSVVRAWAAAHGCYCIGVRAVSDRADEVVDTEMIGWVNAVGAVRPGRVIGSILRKPGVVRRAVRMGRAVKAAYGALGGAVACVVKELESGEGF